MGRYRYVGSIQRANLRTEPAQTASRLLSFEVGTIYASNHTNNMKNLKFEWSGQSKWISMNLVRNCYIFLTRRIRLWTQIQILRLRTRNWSSVIWRNYISNLGKTVILHHPTIMSQSERNHLNLNKPDATSEMQMYRSQAKYRGVIPFFIRILVEILSSW